MEEYQNCPICFEIPEKEIYQCAGGHIICHVCISSLTECPQCRAKYGGTKIRSRVLEALLDTQNFECRLRERGCRHVCKRSEISSHVNFCNFNLETVKLCKLVGKDCTFGLGWCTEKQIIEHFQGEHKFTIVPSQISTNGKFFRSWINRLSNETKSVWIFGTIISMRKLESTALFLCCAVLNKHKDFVSFTCAQVFGSNADSKNYKMECKFLKGAQESVTQNQFDPTSGKSTSDVAVNPFPIVISQNVCTLKEIESMLMIGAVGLPVKLLKTARFGDRVGDELVLKVIPQ